VQNSNLNPFYVSFGVLMAVIIETTDFGDVMTPCSSADRYERSGETCCLRLKGRKSAILNMNAAITSETHIPIYQTTGHHTRNKL
jgi:hypothetical protein